MISHRQHMAAHRFHQVSMTINDFRVFYLWIYSLHTLPLQFKRSPSGPLLSPHLTKGGATNKVDLVFASGPIRGPLTKREAATRGALIHSAASSRQSKQHQTRRNACAPHAPLSSYTNYIIWSQDGASWTHDCRPVLVVHALVSSIIHTVFTCCIVYMLAASTSLSNSVHKTELWWFVSEWLAKPGEVNRSEWNFDDPRWLPGRACAARWSTSLKNFTAGESHHKRNWKEDWKTDFLHKTPNWIKLVDGSDGPHTEISNSALEYDLIAFSTAPPERLPGSILRRLYVVHLL